jgi:serine/threonine protein kinase
MMRDSSNINELEDQQKGSGLSQGKPEPDFYRDQCKRYSKDQDKKSESSEGSQKKYIHSKDTSKSGSHIIKTENSSALGSKGQELDFPFSETSTLRSQDSESQEVVLYYSGVPGQLKQDLQKWEDNCSLYIEAPDSDKRNTVSSQRPSYQTQIADSNLSSERSFSSEGGMYHADKNILDRGFSPSPQIQDGQLLGKYRIIKQSGEGGFGQVFHAKDTQLGEDVAIKVLMEGAVENFRKEIETQASLEHRNIVPILNFGRLGKVPFVVMKYMPGGSLEDKISDNCENNGKGMSIEQTAKLIGGPGKALSYMHEKGFVHRDVKPANTLLETNCGSDQSGTDEERDKVTDEQILPKDTEVLTHQFPVENYEARLCDFGLTVPAEEAKDNTIRIEGTPFYMPFERWKHKKESQSLDSSEQSDSQEGQGINNDCFKADVYGLGVAALDCHAPASELNTGEAYSLVSCMEQNQKEQMKNWKEKHKSEKWLVDDDELDSTLNYAYLSKKFHEWIVSKYVSEANAKKDYEFYLFLSRVVDKDPKKRPNAKAFVQGLWQTVGKPLD